MYNTINLAPVKNIKCHTHIIIMSAIIFCNLIGYIEVIIVHVNHDKIEIT